MSSKMLLASFRLKLSSYFAKAESTVIKETQAVKKTLQRRGDLLVGNKE